MVELPDTDSISRILVDAADKMALSTPRNVAAQYKDDGSVVTAIDLQLQEYISGELKRHWPHFTILGEEMEHAAQAEILETESPGVWSIDPLDGTTNYAAGFPFYGVSAALIVNGHSQVGVVYDPVRRETFSARRGEGARLNGIRLHTPEQPLALRDCVANVDYKRLMTRLSDRLVRSCPYRSQRNLGTSVIEWCWLAAGRMQLYLHGGQKLWDFAAGSLILSEAGGFARSIEGEDIDGRSMAKRSVVAAINAPLFKAWYKWVAESVGHGSRANIN